AMRLDATRSTPKAIQADFLRTSGVTRSASHEELVPAVRSSSRASRSAARSEPARLADDLVHDFARAPADRVEAGVAEEALHEELAHVAVTAVDLHRLIDDF